MAVHCPQCEGVVEATAKFCLACGQDFDSQSPVTSTGHDIRQLKDAIRARDDLSMADKFDLIAKVEEGANPIELGIAATADEAEEMATAAPVSKPGAPAGGSGATFTSSPAAAAAVASVSSKTDAWANVLSGKVTISDPQFQSAMKLGMEASHHIHDIAAGGIDEIDLTSDDLRAIPVLKPPKRSFCPKCGSDILSHTNLQWRKWRDHSGEVVQLQVQAAMETALVQASSHYVGAAEGLQARIAELDEEKLTKKIEKKITKKLTKKITEEIREELETEIRSEAAAAGRSVVRTSATSTATRTSGKAEKGGEKKAPVSMFSAGPVVTKKFEGKKKDKPDWFLTEALDMIFDPHGTGKPLKPKTILARSSDGNVRVQDVVTIYADKGEEGLSELAWTSPFTRYIIEAYDAC